MFLLMLTLMSGVFSLVMLMLCLCACENQPLQSRAKHDETFNFKIHTNLIYGKIMKSDYRIEDHGHIENVLKIIKHR